MEIDKEENGERAVTTLKAPFVKPRKTVKKRHGEEILSKVCAIEVCKPEICCADLEGKLSFPTTAQTSFRWVRKAIYFFAFYVSLGTSWMDKIMRSPLEAQHDPIIPRFLSYAVLFEPAMAASCNFLSYLSSDNVVTRNIVVDRLIVLRSGKMRRGDNFVKTFRWKTTIKPRESAMSGGNIDKRSLF